MMRVARLGPRLARALGAAVSLVALCACDVSSTVGYNDQPLVPGGCVPDASLHACASGGCVVTDLFAALHGIVTMAVDADDAYFVSAPGVLAKRPVGGGKLVELSDQLDQMQRITVDADHVYWTEFDGRVRGVPKAGGPIVDVTKVFGHPTSITADADDLYFVMPPTGEIVMAPTPSGMATRLDGQAAPQAIALDGENVYWVNQGDAGAANGKLVRAPRGNLTAAEVVASNLDAPVTLALSDDAVFWTSSAALYTVPKAGGSPARIADGFNEPKNVAELDGFVYVVGLSGFTRTAVHGGATELLDGRWMSSMALGCDGIYATGWTDDVMIRYGK